MITDIKGWAGEGSDGELLFRIEGDIFDSNDNLDVRGRWGPKQGTYQIDIMLNKTSICVLTYLLQECVAEDIGQLMKKQLMPI